MASRRESISGSGSLDHLAKRYVEARAQVLHAARALHDEVGPLLAGAGIRISLIKSDFPPTAASIEEALAVLDQALERIRALSQELSPSPVDRVGLRGALLRLAEQDFRLRVNYSATAKVPREIGAVLYEIASEAIGTAIAAKADVIQVRVTGTSAVTIRITDNGSASTRKRALFLRFSSALANNSGIIIQIAAKKSTIVSTIYARGRAAG